MSKRKARGENCMGKKKKCIDLTGFCLDTINGRLKLLATIPKGFSISVKGWGRWEILLWETFSKLKTTFCKC